MNFIIQIYKNINLIQMDCYVEESKRIEEINRLTTMFNNLNHTENNTDNPTSNSMDNPTSNPTSNPMDNIVSSHDYVKVYENDFEINKLYLIKFRVIGYKRIDLIGIYRGKKLEHYTNTLNNTKFGIEVICRREPRFGKKDIYTEWMPSELNNIIVIESIMTKRYEDYENYIELNYWLPKQTGDNFNVKKYYNDKFTMYDISQYSENSIKYKNILKNQCIMSIILCSQHYVDLVNSVEIYNILDSFLEYF